MSSAFKRPTLSYISGALVLVLAAPLNSVNSVAGLCVQALSSSCPRLGRAPELCQLCGWALWLGLLGRAPDLCQLCGWAL